MRSIRLVAILSVFFALALSTSGDNSCEGNACSDIRFTYEAGCHIAKNVGSRTVNVTRGNISCHLKAGESCKAVNAFNGSCLQYLIGKNTANYAD